MAYMIRRLHLLYAPNPVAPPVDDTPENAAAATTSFRIAVAGDWIVTCPRAPPVTRRALRLVPLLVYTHNCLKGTLPTSSIKSYCKIPPLLFWNAGGCMRAVSVRSTKYAGRSAIYIR